MKTVYAMDDIENMYCSSVYHKGYVNPYAFRVQKHPKERPTFARAKDWQMWYEGDDMFIGEYPGTHIVRLYGNLYEGGGAVWKSPITCFLFQERFLHTFSRSFNQWGGKPDGAYVQTKTLKVDVSQEAWDRYVKKRNMSWGDMEKMVTTRNVPFDCFETPAPPSKSTHKSNMEYLVKRFLNSPALKARDRVRPRIGMDEVRGYSAYFDTPIPLMDECLKTETKLLAKAVIKRLTK
tara:strand:- start:765 stop:1469 length:705 start_codon:yes stop_codon:yes gene_type:complete